ncbi:MAG TPA: PAS domain S-box protein, partial [Blastocatellia bacterium]|nr:PAS domain S-box protein [Blastocatellia bacterium]
VKSGGLHVGLLSAEPMEINGEPCALVVVNDITRRKQAEEALRASEERFYKAFYASPQPMSISTVKEGRFIEVNDAFLAANGYTREELIGRTSLELGLWVDPQDRAEMARLLAQQGEVRNREYRFRMKNGDIRVFLLSAEIITIGGEKCFLVVTHDITERKQAEEALRASEERFSRAFHSNPLPMSIATLRGGRYIAVNESFLRAGGYTREEVIGHTADELGVWAAGADRHRFARALKRQGAIRDLEVRLRKKSGEVITALLSGEIIEIGGEPCVLATTNDITERKRTEEALRASDARYRAFVEQSSDGIFRLELEQPLSIKAPEDEQIEHLYRYCYVAECNDAMAHMYGYPSAKEILGKRLDDFIVRSDPNNVEYMRSFVRSGYRLLDDESYEIDAQGNPKWFLNTCVGIIEDGRLTRIWGAQRDVTERRQAERERAELLRREQVARHEAEQMNALRAELLARERAARAEAEAARREWQTTFDTMTDAVLLADSDDRLVRANHAFYKMVGLAPDQCIGRSVGELVHGETTIQKDASACPVCEMRRRGERGAVELPAGVVSPYPVFASVDPIVDGDGRTVAVVQVVRDLTALHRARKEAERERTSLLAIIEQMAEGMMVFDEKGMVIHANQPAQHLFGFTLERMRADHDGSLARGRFTDMDGRTLSVRDLPTHMSLRERRVVDKRLWYSGPDGRRRLLAITVSPFFNNEENHLAGAIALVRDVTEQQREYERMQQADKLRALGQLASGVAHNFNNALAAVIGYTQLALPKVQGSDVEKYLRVIEQSAKDAARMVERIQNFSRGTAQADDFRLVRLADIVRDAVDITRPRWRHDAEAQGIRYDVSVAWQADEELLVRGDATELREVCVNIILNALDAMPSGGSLDIRASTKEDAIGVSFTDTGGGMTEEIKGRIFEPFFSTKGVAGLGMGLSESYRIVERHSGRIDVESQMGVGTTFTVTLPVARKPQRTDRAQANPAALQSARVLVLDDEESVRSVLAAILIEQGHEVIEADDAEEALILLESVAFHIVFTDLAMPGTDGVAAASRIKSRAPATKVVLMSGYGADKASQMAGDAGCVDAVISKPFRLDEIREVLKQLLRR